MEPGRRLSRLLAIAVLCAACGQPAAPPLEDDPYPDAPLDVVECSTLVPGATSAPPATRVALGVLPSSFVSSSFAIVRTDGESDVAAAIDWGGDAPMLVTPVHPSTDPAGGAVEIWITDGTVTCAPFDFTISALAPAPGELAEVVDLLQQLIDAQAAALEADRATLLETPPQDLPPALIPLAVVQSALSDPNNPASLEAIANGTADLDEDPRLDLLESLIATTGLKAALADEVSSFGAPVGGQMTNGPRGPVRVGAQTCLPGTVGSDPGLLNECMNVGLQASLDAGGALASVQVDFALVFTATGLIPGLGQLSAVAAFITWMSVSDKVRTAALLPTLVLDFTVDADPFEFLEDEAGPGSWSTQLTAGSTGFDLGFEMVDGLLNAAGLAGVFDELLAGVDDIQLGGPKLEDLKAAIFGLITGPVAQALVGNETLSEFSIPPETFGPVDIRPEQWSETVFDGNALAEPQHGQYDPVAPGEGRIVVRNLPGTFGGHELNDDLLIFVNELQVSIFPDDVTLAGMQEQTFTVTVTDADRPDMIEIVDPENLIGGVTMTYDGAETYTITYETPADPDPGLTELLTVRHKGETGSLAESGIVRSDVATIRYAGVEVTADETCIEPGQRAKFSANIPGMPNAEFEWTVSDGSIDAEGNFTAPFSSGTVVVTATLSTNNDIKGTAEIRVGGCSCSVTWTIDGIQVDMTTGLPNFELTADQSAVRGVNAITQQGIPPNTAFFTFGTTPSAPVPVAVGATGTSPAVAMGYSTAYGANFSSYTGPDDDPTILPMSVTLTQNENGDILEGFAFGSVTLLTDPERVVPFSMEFTLVAEEGPSTSVLRRCLVG